MKARAILASFGVTAVLVAVACVEPPPKIASIPAGGLALRVFVFGASAQEARQAFDAAKQTNKNLAIVREGGDGEILLGLENDSPKCVAPTALCSFKVAVRVRDNQGKVVHSTTETAAANGERCGDLCDRAINIAVVKAVEAASASLKGGTIDVDAGVSTEPVDAGAADASEPDAAAPPLKKGATKPKAEPAPPKPEPPKAEPAMCAIAHGPHLPTEEAEKRAAQVEALKRIGILEQEEYDCLRKAYLDRL